MQFTTSIWVFLGKRNASLYTCDEEWNQDEEIALHDINDNNSELAINDETF